MRIACWIQKTTNTHSGYAILTAFPQQQWLGEGPSMLRYTYIARPVQILYKYRTLQKINFQHLILWRMQGGKLGGRAGGAAAPSGRVTGAAE